MLAGYAVVALNSDKVIYHLRQTPLALHRHETRENTDATLMLRKVFLSEIWNTKRVIFSPTFLLSRSFIVIEKYPFSQSKGSRCKKCFR